MSRDVRSRIYLLVLVVAIFAVWKYRQTQPALIHIKGTTMGSIVYNVKYIGEADSNIKPQIDSLLTDFNQALSTYIPGSEISTFNKTGKIAFVLPYFPEVLKVSSVVFNATNGAFDPTIAPLIDAWGFGDGLTQKLDSAKVDSLMTFVGYDKVIFNDDSASKTVAGLKLNFSAIAKGQAVDVLADWLTSIGISDFMVEIGGELRASGTGFEDKAWSVGIEVPDDTTWGQLFDAVYLKDRGMAASGNYKNYRMLENGQKVAHTIDPKTGFPKMQTLLSATILAPTCILADGYATACMVLGLEKSIELIDSNSDLEGYFIYADENGKLVAYISDGLKPDLVKDL